MASVATPPWPGSDGKTAFKSATFKNRIKIKASIINNTACADYRSRDSQGYVSIACIKQNNPQVVPRQEFTSEPRRRWIRRRLRRCRSASPLWDFEFRVCEVMETSVSILYFVGDLLLLSLH